MKKIIYIIPLFFTIISCGQNEIKEEFKIVVKDYIEKYPITKKSHKEVYVVDFSYGDDQFILLRASLNNIPTPEDEELANSKTILGGIKINDSTTLYVMDKIKPYKNIYYDRNTLDSVDLSSMNDYFFNTIMVPEQVYVLEEDKIKLFHVGDSVRLE